MRYLGWIGWIGWMGCGRYRRRTKIKKKDNQAKIKNKSVRKKEGKKKGCSERRRTVL
jgi:hypothetical protein